MSWSIAFTIVIGLSLLVAVYGLIILLCAGVTHISTLCLAPLITYLCIGILSLASPVIGWNIVVLLLISAIFAIVLIFIRCGIHRTSVKTILMDQAQALRKNLSSINWLLLIPLAAGMIFNLISVVLNFILPAENADVLLQDYDIPFHYSLIRHIIDTGTASPIGAGSITGTPTTIYPDLWHASVVLVAQLFSTSIQQAVWIENISLSIMFTPIAMCLFTLTITKSRKWYIFFLPAAFSTVVPVSITTFGFACGLFSNFLGLALLPYALCWLITSFHSSQKEQALKYIQRSCIGLAAFIVLGLSHPNIAILYLVILLPFFVCQCKKPSARIGIVALYVIGWVVLFNSSFMMRTINCMDRIGTSSKYSNALFTKLGIDYAQFCENTGLVILLCSIPVILALIVSYLLRKKWTQSWYIVSFGICVTLLMFVFFPLSSPAGFMTGFWYRDILRFVVFVVTFAIPLAVVFTDFVVEQIAKRLTNIIPQRIALTAVSILIALIWGICAFRPSGIMPHFLSAYGTIVDKINQAEDLSPEQAAFSESVASYVDDEVVLNNFSDGSVWLYAQYGVNALLKGRPASQMASMDESLQLLIDNIDKIADDSPLGESVRAAAKKYDLAYVVKMSNEPNYTTVYNDLEQVQYHVSWAITNVDENTPGFDLVLEENGFQLYRLQDSLMQ